MLMILMMVPVEIPRSQVGTISSSCVHDEKVATSAVPLHPLPTRRDL